MIVHKNKMGTQWSISKWLEMVQYQLIEKITRQMIFEDFNFDSLFSTTHWIDQLATTDQNLCQWVVSNWSKFISMSCLQLFENIIPNLTLPLSGSTFLEPTHRSISISLDQLFSTSFDLVLMSYIFDVLKMKVGDLSLAVGHFSFIPLSWQGIFCRSTWSSDTFWN